MAKISYYPVELHTHTKHSDGQFEPDTLALAAKKAGLKGFALTDHNTKSGWKDAQKYAKECGLCFIKGIEWTTFYGHITVLGTGSDTDWRTVNKSNVLEKAQEAAACGDCVGIAHPYRIGYPICTGGSDDWDLGTSYKPFTHYEVWSYINPALDRTNELAYARYKQLLRAGNRMACVYGRDWHGESDGLFAVTSLGVDGELTAESALEAIKKGRTYISFGLSADIEILDGRGSAFVPGDSVKSGAYKLIIGVKSANMPMYSAYKTECLEAVISGTATRTLNLSLTDGNANDEIKLTKGYFNVELKGKVNGVDQTVLIASPIYVED